MLRILPPPPHLVRKKSYIDDEQDALYRQIMNAIDEVDDPDLREEWLDSLQTFATSGDMGALFNGCDNIRPCVDMETFMFDSAYLALEQDKIFPSVIEACIELDSDRYTEAVLKGALGTGKTTIANIMLARGIYKISCMRDPQSRFGIPSKSSIVFTIQSVRFNTAKKAVFEEFGQYLGKSPYFTNIYPYDPKVQSQMMFRRHNLSILPVSSSSTGVISMNVLGGILDEMNFMQKIEKSKSAEADAAGAFDQAKRLYDTIARRRKSRFTKKGKLPGILFVVSSSRFPDDFTEVKAAESTMCGGTDPTIYVYSHSQWSAKPRDTFLAEEFQVLIGTENIRSKILTDGDYIPEGATVIDVPMDFYPEFEKDVEGSIRDFAGLTSLATNPFITKRDSIHQCMSAATDAGYRNIFNMEEIDLSLGIPQPVLERLRLDVNEPRACHIDLGVTKDAAGLAIGHVAGMKYVEKRDAETNMVLADWMPVVAIDTILRIVPPPNDEIEFSDIRKLVITLRDKYKLPIKWVTMDGFQSVDSRQIFRKHGFMVDYLSVEKIEPYRTMRDALYDTRLLIPKHTFVAKELAELEQITKNNKLRVDHKPSGSKDCADAICGVTAFLMSRRGAWTSIKADDRSGLQLLGNKEIAENIRLSTVDNESLVTYYKRPQVVRRTVQRRNISRK